MASDAKTSDSASDVSAPRDEVVLAGLGYKQEFKRAFTPWESFGIAFSIIGLVPSMACVTAIHPSYSFSNVCPSRRSTISFALSNGGPVSMVWGVRSLLPSSHVKD